MNAASRNRRGLDRRNARTPAARSSSTPAFCALPQRLAIQVVAAKPSAMVP
jgi:hypothetical protein